MSEAFEPAQTTLFLSLEHQNAKIRLLALERLEEILSSSSDLADNSFVKASLLQRLSDDSSDVVSFVLDMPQLSFAIDAFTLVDALAKLYDGSKDAVIRGKTLLLLVELIEKNPKTETADIRDIVLGSALLTKMVLIILLLGC